MFRKKKKKSFIERITGAVHLDDELLDEDEIEEEAHQIEKEIEDHSELTEESLEGELAVDVLNTDESIIIKAMIAGVRPSDVDIDISRDMVTIRDTREESTEISEDGYFQKELFWGTFSRNILLPEEIDVDESEAKEKNGLLILSLPKIDKNRKTKLQVKG
jgi:HSP20 family molecular chaperone IbpA